MRLKINTSKRSGIVKLGIGCIVGLLLSFGVLLYAQEKTKAEFFATKPDMDAVKKSETDSAKAEALMKMKEQAAAETDIRSRWRQARGGGVDFGENQEFYQVIVDNNLFRPLGWTPPKDEPSYSLVGTTVGTDGGASQATLLERRSNRYYFVTIGAEVGDMIVKDIQPKQVTLDKAGEPVTLRAGGLQFLATQRGNDGGSRGGDRSGGERAASSDNRADANAKMDADKAKLEEMKSRAGAFGMGGEMAEKIRNASPEERREIIRSMRRNMGDRGGARGDRGGRGRRGRD